MASIFGIICSANVEWEMASHSSIRAWKIPWTEETGGLQSMGSQRVGHKHANTLQIIVLKQHQVGERIKIVMQGDFPGDPVAETPHSQGWEPDSILAQGTRSHMPQLKDRWRSW